MIWCGDINSDFRRNSGQVAPVGEAVTELNFLKIWDKYQIDFTCVHNVNDGNVVTSTIDHFFCSSEIGNAILDAGVIHSPDNRSDHSPFTVSYLHSTSGLTSLISFSSLPSPPGNLHQ